MTNGVTAEGTRSGLPRGPLPRPPPDWVVRGAIGLRNGLIRLANALLPPEVQVYERAMGVAYTAALGAFVRGGYVAALDAGPISAADVAARVDRPVDPTFRFLHALASAGVLRMRSDGRFEHGSVSRTLRPGHPSRAAAFVEYFASRSNIAAWLDFDASLATGKGAFDRVHGMSVWEWFDAHPTEREAFAHAMMGLTVRIAPIVAERYPFGEVNTVCDVGGGRGTLLSEVLLQHPHLHGVLLDAPGVLASAQGLLAHRGLTDRVRLTPGSFFERVPAGADVYLLKNVLHDWDDERCATILGHVRAATRPGQRVVIVENLLDRARPDPMTCPADLQMMVVCVEGRERDLADFQRLLRGAGFEPGRVWTHATVGIVEGVAP